MNFNVPEEHAAEMAKKLKQHIQEMLFQLMKYQMA